MKTTTFFLQLRRDIPVLSGFAALAVFFFMPFDVPHKIVLPALFASVCCIAHRIRLAGMAFALSAVGDLAGSFGMFLPQLVFFAIAHVVFIVCFARLGNRRHLPPTIVIAALAVACVLLLAAAVCNIIMYAPAGIMRTATAVYSLLILTMFCCATLTRNALFAAGALFFVASDFVLAWNKFNEHVSNAGLLIMTTYYAALLLLFAGFIGSKRRGTRL